MSVGDSVAGRGTSQSRGEDIMFETSVRASAGVRVAAPDQLFRAGAETDGALVHPIRELFAHYGNVRVVSLPDRTDRRALLERDIRRAGLTPQKAIRYFDAIRCAGPGPFRKVGSHGAMLSHLEILRQGGPVLILQDDCKFMQAQLFSIGADVDIFYGSHERDAEEIIGCHCMGFSARAAALAADYLERIYREGPPESHPYPFLPPIDGLLVWFRREHPELKTEFQFLATQRSSRSDVSPGPWDRMPGLGSALNVARRSREVMSSAIVHRFAVGF